MPNTLIVTASHDYSGETITNTNEIFFDTPVYSNNVATFTASQFGAGLISNNVLVVKSPGNASNVITVNLGAATSFSAAGWSIQFQVLDSIEINGSANDDTIIGSSINDTIQGGAGSDTLAGGPGDDTYYLNDVHEVIPVIGRAVSGVDTGQTSPIQKIYAYDTVIENPGEGYDTVVVESQTNGTAYTLPANVESGVVNGLPGFVLTGNDLDNALYVGVLQVLRAKRSSASAVTTLSWAAAVPTRS